MLLKFKFKFIRGIIIISSYFKKGNYNFEVSKKLILIERFLLSINKFKT